MRFKVIAVCVLVIVAQLGAIGFVWQQTRVMAQQMKTLDQKVTTLEGELKKANSTIVVLKQQNAERAQQQARLRRALEKSQTEANRRIQQLRALQHEQLKAWSSQSLPDRIIRMRQRPTIRGAESYRDYLRNSESLPALSEQPENGG